MTSFKDRLTKLKNKGTKITFEDIKESFYGLNHNPEEKIDREHYELLRHCLKVCQNVINDKNNDSSEDKKSENEKSEDEKKAEDILKIFLSVKFSDGSTLLHKLIEKENLEQIKLLINISSTKQLNAKNQYKSTPLHYAVLFHKSEIVQFLIKSEKVNVNAKDKAGNTPLHIAIQNRFHDKFEYIIDLLIKLDNIDINAKDEFERTPLHYATSNEILGEVYEIRLKVVNLLIEKKANVNEQDKGGKTPLHWAAKHGHKEMVESLITADAKINVKDEYGMTPLDYAKSLDDEMPGKQNIIYLLEKEVSKHQANNAFYKTAMITTIMASIAATTLFTTETLPSTELNIIYAAGIIALSTFIITNLVYGVALEIYSTPSPKLENTETEKNIAQVTSVA